MSKYSILEQIAAWAVHVFTSSGIVAGLAGIIAIAAHEYQMAAFWLLVTQIIDGVDGSFARRFRVSEVLPAMSGKTIDYVVDFCTYAVIPGYWFYNAPDLLPDGFKFIGASIVLLTSAIYYGKEGMVDDSEDYYFVGFPVMWNFVVFYLHFVLCFSPVVNFSLIIIFGILHFVPTKYVYPSRTKRFQVLNIFMFIACMVSCLMIGYLFPQKYILLDLVAVATALYFGLIGFWEDTSNK